MYARSAAWQVLAGLTLACGSTVSDPMPSSDAAVSHTEPGGFCAAFAVMQNKCVRCHSNPPAHGAPFALDSYEATQVPDGESIRADRMHAVIESGFMPLTSLRLDPPVEPLTCAEKATILDWIEQGAAPPPDADPRCETTDAVPLACDSEGHPG